MVKFKRKHKMLLVSGLCLPPPPPASLPAFSGLKPTVFIDKSSCFGVAFP